METRLERNKRLKKLKYIKRFKRLCIIILLMIFFLGLELVNQTMNELNNWTYTSIIDFDFETKELNIFGKTYIIDLSLIKD